MKRLVRKNFLINQVALKKAQKILGAKTESETVRKALDLITFQREVMRGFDRAAGKLKVERFSRIAAEKVLDEKALATLIKKARRALHRELYGS